MSFKASVRFTATRTATFITPTRLTSAGIDLMNTTYNFLDLTAKGRDENPDSTQDWVRYHDKYKKGRSTRCL